MKIKHETFKTKNVSNKKITQAMNVCVPLMFDNEDYPAQMDVCSIWDLQKVDEEDKNNKNGQSSFA
jgi:hypothetical protein